MGALFTLNNKQYNCSNNIVNDSNDNIADENYKETYFTKNMTNLTQSNISLQNSFNRYNENKILNYFEIEKKSEGWTSEIFLLKSENTKLIKKVYNKDINNNILKENFNNEVNSLILMKGEKHIPKIYDINFSTLTLIIEYCGKSLNHNNAPVNWKEQLTEIFKILRKYHIYHNDIHMNNFCVNNEVIYLIDFGLAKHHIDFQYQNISLDIIEKSCNISELFSKIRENGSNIRKCLFCDENFKNL